MQVKFRDPFFGPHGSQFPKGVQDVPEEMLDKLPKTAEIVDPNYVKNKTEEEQAAVAVAERMQKARDGKKKSKG